MIEIPAQKLGFELTLYDRLFHYCWCWQQTVASEHRFAGQAEVVVVEAFRDRLNLLAFVRAPELQRPFEVHVQGLPQIEVALIAKPEASQAMIRWQFGKPGYGTRPVALS